MDNSINHKAILGAYLNAITDSDLAVIMDARKKHAGAAMNGNLRMVEDATNHSHAMIGHAIDKISPYDLLVLGQVVKAWR